MTCVVGAIDGRAMLLGADSAAIADDDRAVVHALTVAGVAPAHRRLELAIATAAHYTASVRPPWQFVRTGQ